MQKTNMSYPFIRNNEIIEWDIKSANTSLMRYYNLQPEKIIAKFESLPKEQREIRVGKFTGKNKEFSSQLENSFNTIIQEFMDANDLTWDNIVAIKKDAVFVKNHKIIKTEFGPVKFRPKNQYQHVLLLPKYEIYLSPQKIDVKGIADDKLYLHENGMLEFIRSTFEYSDNCISMHKFFKEFVYEYKNRELEFDMYREFTSNSVFSIGGEFPMKIDTMIEEDIDFLDISYNYINVVIPTIQATF